VRTLAVDLGRSASAWRERPERDHRVGAVDGTAEPASTLASRLAEIAKAQDAGRIVVAFRCASMAGMVLKPRRRRSLRTGSEKPLDFRSSWSMSASRPRKRKSP